MHGGRKPVDGGQAEHQCDGVGAAITLFGGLRPVAAIARPMATRHGVQRHPGAGRAMATRWVRNGNTRTRASRSSARPMLPKRLIRSVLRHAHAASGAAAEMHTTLLDCSRLEAGVVKVRPEAFAAQMVQIIVQPLHQPLTAPPQGDVPHTACLSPDTTAPGSAQKPLRASGAEAP